MTCPGLDSARKIRTPPIPWGRKMIVRSTQPGVQLYTGNFLDGTIRGRSGTVYDRHAGFCVETQAFPDAINRPEFPSCVLRPGEQYHHLTEFEFQAG